MTCPRKSALALAWLPIVFACGGNADISIGDDSANHDSPIERELRNVPVSEGTATATTIAPPVEDGPTLAPSPSPETPPVKPPVAPPAPACTGKLGKAGDHTLTLKVDGQTRTAIVHVPAGYDPTRATPLVVGFHGYGQSAAQMRSQTKLDSAADKRGVIVAYAQGTGLIANGFNGGDCCGAPAWGFSRANDVGFAKAIVKAIEADYCVDAKRVHSAGFSNGGFLAYRIACEASDVFSSVASVSGVLGIAPEACKPTRAAPLLHVHGTADLTVPYNGGLYRSVATSTGAFRTKWACGPATIVSSNGDTTCQAWKGTSGSLIELCTVDGGGHQWPGGERDLLGGKLSSFDATSKILDFFEMTPMP